MILVIINGISNYQCSPGTLRDTNNYPVGFPANIDIISSFEYHW